MSLHITCTATFLAVMACVRATPGNATDGSNMDGWMDVPKRAVIVRVVPRPITRVTIDPNW